MPSCLSRIALLGLFAALAPTAFAAEPDQSPLAITTVPAFPNLHWSGWEPLTDAGKPAPLRTILITNAGDTSGRLFAPTQQGTIYAFANREDASKTEVFLDLTSKVVYKETENEEGLLGLAFHPKYKDNGKFYVYYTSTEAPHLSVISQFTVSKDNPNRADATSEKVIMKIPQPFWNHNGGTIVFGPDGMLYVGLGDGGHRNDPEGNGQNLGTLLGSILRIDVDHHTQGLGYAVPKDNPFVGREGARPEIWAYGVRNIWRMSFDRQNGALWAGDVGQDLWEEIDIITRGGNYGWNHREALHPFGPEGKQAGPAYIEPIFEYHHDIGKSITGGHVYRGKKLPELAGHYLYADYVSGKIWALKYDDKAKQVTANRVLQSPQRAVISFGEDEAGEVYLTIVAGNGQTIFRFDRAEAGK